MDDEFRGSINCYLAISYYHTRNSLHAIRDIKKNLPSEKIKGSLRAPFKSHIKETDQLGSNFMTPSKTFWQNTY